jgi:hypothetical protein
MSMELCKCWGEAALAVNSIAAIYKPVDYGQVVGDFLAMWTLHTLHMHRVKHSAHVKN